jgi:DNA-binding GntR family transcriptional regulator
MTSNGIDLMRPMKRQASLRERCLVAIRARIITGEIRPGTIWSGPAIAQQLGVSATPVREAMLDLAREGLVEAVPNRGFRILELSDADLDEIHAIRLLLEVPAIVAITGDRQLLTDNVLRRLRGLCDDLERRAASGDVEGMIDVDTKFHTELIRLTGNRRLVDLVARLRSQTLRYGLHGADRATLVAIAADHENIIAAVIEGDKEKTRGVMERHLSVNRGILAERPDPGSTSDAVVQMLAAK